MRLLLRAAAVVLVLVAALLIYAIIAAVTSDEGARVGICILYAAISIAALFGARALWSRPSGSATV